MTVKKLHYINLECFLSKKKSQLISKIGLSLRDHSIINLCGHGHFDMSAYDDYFSGNLAEDKFDKQHVDEAISKLPEIG